MLNQFTLVGRITKTPEMMENQDGSKFAIINLAVPRTFKNENGEYDTDFIDVVLFNKIAQSCVEYCEQGDIIGLRGSLQRLKNKDLEVHAEKITFLSSGLNK